MTRSPRQSPAARTALVHVAIVLLLSSISIVATATSKAPVKTGSKPTATKPAESESSDTKSGAAGPASGINSAASGMAYTIPGLPHYEDPPQYSVDLVINTGESKHFVMHRSVDNGRLRTDIDVDGSKFTMIELGDEAGTTYTLMPGEKQGFKQTHKSLEALIAKTGVKPEQVEKSSSHEQPPAAKVENLGEEKLNGHVAKRVRMTMDAGSAVGWFDKETGAPLKMESKVQDQTTSIEWKNMKPGPQPEELFAIPEGYQITDMDEMMAQMKNMGGAGSLGALMGGAGGIGGGLSGAMKGAAGNMGSNFGSQMGAGLGSTLGATLGGPLGAMAGQYIGGKIGGFLGKKAVDTVIPGK